VCGRRFRIPRVLSLHPIRRSRCHHVYSQNIQPDLYIYIYILPDQTDLLITGKTLFQTTIGRETRGGGGGKLMIP